MKFPCDGCIEYQFCQLLKLEEFCRVRTDYFARLRKDYIKSLQDSMSVQ